MSRVLARRETGVAILIGLTVAVVATLNPAFLSAANVRDIAVACVPAAIIGCAMTFVIVTGEIDISVGSLLGLLAAVLGSLTGPQQYDLPVAVGVGLTLLLGTSIGLINGLLVTVGRVPSIIVTLGMMTVLRGVTERVMGGNWITQLPPGLRYCATGTFLSIPISLWTTLAVIAFCIPFASLTPLGRRIYAVGSNVHAARLAGLSPVRIKLFVFTFTGFITAVATVVSVPQLSTIESGIGGGLELLVVTCVVVGGTSISGGSGATVGTILAVILLGMVRNVLIFLKLGEQSVYWERAIQGGFILAAVLADHLARRRKGSHG